MYQDLRAPIQYHRRRGQDNVAINDAVMQHPADWADPGVDVDFGAAPTQRRLPAHRDQRWTLSTRPTTVPDSVPPVGMTTPAHLGRETVIVALIIVRRETLRPVPAIDTYLRANVLALSGFGGYQAAPRWACSALCGTALFPRLTSAASGPDCASCPVRPWARRVTVQSRRP